MADIEKENEEIIDEEIKDEENSQEDAGQEEESGEAPEEEIKSEEEIKDEDQPGSGDESGAGTDEDEGEDGQDFASEEETDESGQGQKKERKLNWTKMAKDKPSKETKEDILNAQLAEEKEKYARLLAEFDNFRKRNEKEKDQMYDFGAKVVVEKILPVIDNFERGLSALSDEEKDSAFAQGMDKTYKQFLSVLEGIGVKPIEALGAQFDPEIHNAVMHVDDEEAGENVVVEEFQKGYMYKDKLVRPSMVKVAN